MAFINATKSFSLYINATLSGLTNVNIYINYVSICCFQTRLLVTNSLWVLPHCDVIYVLKDGVISESGSYNELLSHSGPFAEFVQNYLKDSAEEEEDSDGDY